MKQLRSVFLAVLLIVIPMLSFAAPSNRKSITIAEPVKVGDVVLQPGEYSVQWEGSGPQVKVNFTQNNKTVASAPATLQNQSTGYDGALDLRSAQGSDAKTLHAIDFKHMELVFDQGSSASNQ